MPAAQTILETRPKGPIFLAKMPAGDYVIQVTSEGQTLTRKATSRHRAWRPSR